LGKSAHDDSREANKDFIEKETCRAGIEPTSIAMSYDEDQLLFLAHHLMSPFEMNEGTNSQANHNNVYPRLSSSPFCFQRVRTRLD